MQFEWPRMLWLLLLVPALVVAYILAQRRRKRYALRFSNLLLVREAVGRGPGWRRHVPPALFLAGLTVMLFALARPLSVVILPSQESTVILTLDVSGSMRAEDMKPNRLEAAKRAAAEKEFEKSLVAKKYPGIEGEVFESRLLKDIHFDFDRYDIRPGDAEILKENAALLLRYPKVRIQIEGHCDERGTNEYNLALGERRANSAKRYLVSLGISEDRISTISYGEERPLDPGHNEEAWAKNRRAHFVILSK